MTSPTPTNDTTALVFRPVDQAVYTPEQAARYLCVPKDSLAALVRRDGLVPLVYAKEFRYLKAELDRFLSDQVSAERQRRGLSH